MGDWLAVKTAWVVGRGSNLSSTHQACEMEANSSFGDLTLRFDRGDEIIENVELSSTNWKFKIDTPLTHH